MEAKFMCDFPVIDSRPGLVLRSDKAKPFHKLSEYVVCTRTREDSEGIRYKTVEIPVGMLEQMIAVQEQGNCYSANELVAALGKAEATIRMVKGIILCNEEEFDVSNG